MGDEAHGGGKSAARCLSSHDVEAAYQSRAPGRIVWRAWPTPSHLWSWRGQR